MTNDWRFSASGPLGFWEVHAYHGSTVMLVSFRLWVACEWMVYSQKKHQTKGCVFMEAFLLSLMVVAGAMGIMCVKDWHILPVLRLYMLLVSGALSHMKMNNLTN